MLQKDRIDKKTIHRALKKAFWETNLPIHIIFVRREITGEYGQLYTKKFLEYFSGYTFTLISDCQYH